MAMPASAMELMESERLLPSQVLPAVADTAEKALMRAVLARAMEDLRGAHLRHPRGSQARARIRREAREWFLSEEDGYCFSFVSICQALSLDAGALRRAVLAGPGRTPRARHGGLWRAA
jgi:hypothetical protein